jgi:hypothetical protein
MTAPSTRRAILAGAATLPILSIPPRHRTTLRQGDGNMPWNYYQHFGVRSQDRAGQVALNSNHNNKNNLCVLCHWRSRW